MVNEEKRRSFSIDRQKVEDNDNLNKHLNKIFNNDTKKPMRNVQTGDFEE